MYIGAFSIGNSGFISLNGEYMDKYEADQDKWSTILIDFATGELRQETLGTLSEKGYLIDNSKNFYEFTPPQD